MAATLLHAWQGLGQLRDPAKIKVWLLGVARNRCRDHLRSAQRQREHTASRPPEFYLGRAGRTFRDEEREWDVQDAMQQISPTHRDVLRLFYLEGLTIAEISRRARKAEGTIKSRLFHARAAMRRLLETEASCKDERP